MGLLTKGDRLLSWAETKENAEIVRRIGIQQFISSYLRGKDRKEYPYKWGDEVAIRTGVIARFAHALHQ